MQIADIHDNTSRLIIGGIGLSLLGLLSFGLNRVVNALRGRKDLLMARYNSSSRAMVCAPASGVGQAPTARPARSKKQDGRSDRPVQPEQRTDSNGKRVITITGVLKIIGRRSNPPAPDDQLVYLDE